MIKDSNELQQIQESWKTVRITEAMTKTHFTYATLRAVFQASDFRKLSYSLILLFAFSVLEESLKQLRKEKRFTSRDQKLKSLMDSSKNALPWVAFDIVDEGRDLRNKVAHDQMLLQEDQCLKYINAIEDELVSWGVLSSKIQGSYTITIQPNS